MRVPIVFEVHWPSVHESKGAEVMVEILVWPMNVMETALQEIDFSKSDQLYPRV